MWVMGRARLQICGGPVAPVRSPPMFAGMPFAAQPPDPLEIVVVGTDPLARTGIASLLYGRSDLVAVAEVDPDDGLARALAEWDPAVLVWDMAGSHDVSGLPTGPLDVPVLALATDATCAEDALGVGARGVLTRHGGGDRIAAAARAMACGMVVIDNAFAADVLPQREEEPPPSRLDDPLTPREAEVLGLLAEGLSNRHLAQRLAISEHTAKFHVNAILYKLGARTRTDAVVRALRLGVLRL